MRQVTLIIAVVALCAGCSNTATTPPTEPPPSMHKLYVRAKDPYTNSGIVVSANEQLSITATGKAQWRLHCTGSCRVSPSGVPFSTKRCKTLQESKVFGPFTAPGLACFSLIGKISAHGDPFEVGSSLRYTVPANASGDLYLGFNDNLYRDNSGGFEATISF